MHETSKSPTVFVVVVFVVIVVAMLLVLGPMLSPPRLAPTATPTYVPTPTEIVKKATVVYSDNQTADIADWKFKYTFGCRATKPPGSFVYQIETKMSDDLYLQTVTGTLSEEVVISANEIKSIGYIWQTGENAPPPTIMIQTRSGKEYKSSIRPLMAFDSDDISDRSYFIIPDSFLCSSDAYVFKKRLYLVGNVLQDGQYVIKDGVREKFELELFAWYVQPYYKEIINQ